MFKLQEAAVIGWGNQGSCRCICLSYYCLSTYLKTNQRETREKRNSSKRHWEVLECIFYWPKNIPRYNRKPVQTKILENNDTNGSRSSTRTSHLNLSTVSCLIKAKQNGKKSDEKVDTNNHPIHREARLIRPRSVLSGVDSSSPLTTAA